MTGRGRFITVEGGEGAGKSTQARLLGDWLGRRGVPVLLTREPGGSPHAEALRAVLLEGLAAPFGAEAEALLFAVARADHVRRTIRPALAEGRWVICDRFTDSTHAYQGSAGVAAETLRRLDRIAVGDSRPDLTLILDVPSGEGLARAAARAGAADRFESEPADVHQARRRAFLEIAAREPDRCVVVDATAPRDSVAARIAEAVAARLGAYLPEPG